MGSVLAVDDITGNTQLVETLLAPDGHAVRTAGDGAEALRLVRSEHPDLVLMDVMMPHVDGFEACREIKQDPGTRLIPVVLITALNDSASRIRGIDVGADDFVSKPFNAHELRAHPIAPPNQELPRRPRRRRIGDRQSRADDRSARSHDRRPLPASRAVRLRAGPLGLDEDEVSALERGGFLHDVGKVGIPDAVLLKPAPLTPEEYELIKQHAVIGDGLCGELRSLRNVRPIVRHHHERLNGSGYPDGLRDEAFPLLAQITGIVDVFDALTTDRPYRPALRAEDAYEVLMLEMERGGRLS